jgi:hypothetical protein
MWHFNFKKVKVKVIMFCLNQTEKTASGLVTVDNSNMTFLCEESKSIIR